MESQAQVRVNRNRMTPAMSPKSRPGLALDKTRSWPCTIRLNGRAHIEEKRSLFDGVANSKMESCPLLLVGDVHGEAILLYNK